MPRIGRKAPEAEGTGTGARKRRRKSAATKAPENKVEIYVPGPLEIDGQLISHNVWVDGRRTSLRLEAIMWTALNTVAEREHRDIHELVTLISFCQHEKASLTATVRAFLLAYFYHIAPSDSPPILERLIAKETLSRARRSKRS